jgi:hypothetical protein
MEGILHDGHQVIEKVGRKNEEGKMREGAELINSERDQPVGGE